MQNKSNLKLDIFSIEFRNFASLFFKLKAVIKLSILKLTKYRLQAYKTA